MPPKAVAGGPATGEIEIVEFEIEEKLATGGICSNFYGINVEKVREVIKVEGSITPSAKDHPFIEGVIEVRNEVIPVVNLPKWLHKHDPQFKYERVIVAEFNMLRAAFLISKVHRIHKVLTEKIEPPVSLGDRELITGITRIDGKIIMMIDFEKVLSDIDPDAGTDMDDIPPAPASAEPKTVLVVEDSSTMRNMLKSAFKKAGYMVHTAQNGLEALEIIEENSGYFDIITSDVEMPLMDGLTLISRLKEDKALKNIPIIIFSSMASKQNIGKWQMLGADDCLVKPDIARLIERVNEITFGTRKTS